LIHSAVISSAITLASSFSTKIDEYLAPKAPVGQVYYRACDSSMIQAGWDFS
jgi:hypothetical protein